MTAIEDRLQYLENVVSTLLTNLLEPALVGAQLTFGDAGAARLGNEGIQVKSNDTSVGVWFADKFFTGSDYPDPGGYIYGNNWNGTAGELIAEVYKNLASPGVARLTLDANSTGSMEAKLEAQANGGGRAAVDLWSATGPTDYYVGIAGPLALDDVAADYTTVADGQIWYRTDTDKIRARINGTTENVATEGYADAAVTAHTGDTSDAHDASSISILDAAGDFTATDVEGALAELQSDAEGHAAAADPHTGYLLESTFNAKGDLVSASADNTPAVLTVGADDTILMADAAAATGLKWVASASPAAVGTANATGTGDTFSRGDHVHAHEAAHINHDTTWAAKGDLIVGTANDTAQVLSVGATNGHVLTIDSGQTTGLKWAAASGGGMKKVQGSGYQPLPAGPGAGVTVTKSASANTYGSYAEIRSASGNAIYIFGVLAEDWTGTNSYGQISIGTGGAGVETEIGVVKMSQITATPTANYAIFFPAPLAVGASTRIAARWAGNAASADTCILSLITCNQSDLADI